MSRYRKKPVVIDAVQWTGGNPNEIKSFTGIQAEIDWTSGVLFIDTLEGRMSASKGDWIIRGVRGEFYPCKPDIFADTYDEVSA